MTEAFCQIYFFYSNEGILSCCSKRFLANFNGKTLVFVKYPVFWSVYSSFLPTMSQILQFNARKSKNCY